jgi:hypothetical protein
MSRAALRHGCAGERVKATARRDRRRVPSFATISWNPFRTLATGGLSMSSGMDLATQVPAPTNVSKYPSATRPARGARSS